MLKSIALVGNPNCGKTTLFNRLTGANQRIGNWPGVTVEQYQGKYIEPGTKQPIAVVDLPGCYSLVATADMALDEKVTCEYILKENTSIYINVIDASHLSRDLYLSLQLLELGAPVIVALNCMDLAQAAGINIDIEALSRSLGCPVVPITARNGSGIKQLQQEISNYSGANNYKIDYPAALEHIINAWQPYCSAAEAIRILEGDVLLANKFAPANIGIVETRAQLPQQLTHELDVYIAKHRRQTVRNILDTSIVKNPISKVALSESIDRLVLHKIFGPIIFLSVMYLMFTCAINIGGWLQIGFESVSEAIFVTGMHQWLTSLGSPDWLISLLADGLGNGVSITVTFIPVLAAMFLCLGILESSGYMARAAFIIDRLMSHLGLSGRSFVPMIVGFGCNVPAVMGARTLSSKRERILTIMMTPFMSCSARLAIYAIFVAAFFPLYGQNVIFSLYLIGIAVAVLTGLALRSTILSKEESMSLIEIPDYRWPLFSALFRQVWQRLKSFLLKAGILIIVLNVIINGLGHEVLQNVGKYLTPLFAPIGIAAENWPATLGLLTGLIAKEAVVGTLNAFYSSEATMIKYFGSPIEAYAYLLFTLLYFPCVSVVAVIAKELNIKWALFSVVWSTGLAYIIAALFYQIATQNSWLWVTSLSVTLVTFFVIARWMVRRDQNRSARRKLIPTSVGMVN
jgi:ferrous iron transport protein B